MKTVVIFGVFDGSSHEGHKKMLQEAREHGDFLIVVIAQDHMIQHYAGKPPRKNFAQRMEMLNKQDNVDKILIGDKEPWQVVHDQRPDVVAFASDQSALKRAVEGKADELGYSPKIVQLKAYEINE